jgi:membrane protein YqaA with SNARE-associated domain
MRAFRYAAAILTVIAFLSCFLFSMGAQAGLSHCLLRASVVALFALVLIAIIEKIVIGLSR